MMYNKIFNDYSDNSRIWIYGFSQHLTTADKELVQNRLRAFITDWNSHGKNVPGDYFFLYDRFVVISTSHPEISGCSIDSIVGVFRELKNVYGLDALNLNIVFFRNGDKIETVNRAELSAMAAQQLINDQTLVFDMTIQTVGQLRNGEFEKSIRDSWHKVLLRRVA